MFRMNYDLMKNTTLSSSWKIKKKSKTKTKSLPPYKYHPCQSYLWKINKLMAIQNACYWSVFYILAIASSR